jgi:hypothetical protein
MDAAAAHAERPAAADEARAPVTAAWLAAARERVWVLAGPVAGIVRLWQSPSEALLSLAWLVLPLLVLYIAIQWPRRSHHTTNLNATRGGTPSPTGTGTGTGTLAGTGTTQTLKDSHSDAGRGTARGVGAMAHRGPSTPAL